MRRLLAAYFLGAGSLSVASSPCGQPAGHFARNVSELRRHSLVGIFEKLARDVPRNGPEDARINDGSNHYRWVGNGFIVEIQRGTQGRPSTIATAFHNISSICENIAANISSHGVYVALPGALDRVHSAEVDTNTYCSKNAETDPIEGEADVELIRVNLPPQGDWKPVWVGSLAVSKNSTQISVESLYPFPSELATTPANRPVPVPQLPGSDGEFGEGAFAIRGQFFHGVSGSPVIAYIGQNQTPLAIGVLTNSLNNGGDVELVNPNGGILRKDITNIIREILPGIELNQIAIGYHADMLLRKRFDRSHIPDSLAIEKLLLSIGSDPVRKADYETIMSYSSWLQEPGVVALLGVKRVCEEPYSPESRPMFHRRTTCMGLYQKLENQCILSQENLQEQAMKGALAAVTTNGSTSLPVGTRIAAINMGRDLLATHIKNKSPPENVAPLVTSIEKLLDGLPEAAMRKQSTKWASSAKYDLALAKSISDPKFKDSVEYRQAMREVLEGSPDNELAMRAIVDSAGRATRTPTGLIEADRYLNELVRRDAMSTDLAIKANAAMRSAAERSGISDRVAIDAVRSTEAELNASAKDGGRN